VLKNIENYSSSEIDQVDPIRTSHCTKEKPVAVKLVRKTKSKYQNAF
jgi:hypothetical protein